MEKINEEIQLLKDYQKINEDFYKKAYQLNSCYPVIAEDRSIEEEIAKKELQRDVSASLKEKGIELDKKYFVMDNVYLEFFWWGSSFTFDFYIGDDSWLYDYYFGSHSGINEWISAFITETTGNSKYDYAFETIGLNDFKRQMESGKLLRQFINFLLRKIVNLKKQYLRMLMID